MIKLESLSKEYLIGIINAMALKFSDEVEATPDELVDEAYAISNGLTEIPSAEYKDHEMEELQNEIMNLDLISQHRRLTVAEISRFDEISKRAQVLSNIS